MTEPPELDHRTVSAAEMEKLLSDDHELQKRIGECRVQSITPEKPTHESFCIKKEISRFVDPISDDEVALITDYVNRDGSKSSVISRLRIGNTVYELEIP